MLQFQSSGWTISGLDRDGQEGVAGIAVSNDADGIGGQLDLPGLPTRIDQVSGIDAATGEPTTGAGAIIENPELSPSLDTLYSYFCNMGEDISGIGRLDGTYLGDSSHFQILRADLSQGTITLPGARTGYGILILQNEGEFQMDGNSEWYGLILCYGGATISMRGGGNSAAHVYGCVMIADGTVTMNGTADIQYSSKALWDIYDQLIAYQVYSWCGGWGKPLARFGNETGIASSGF